MLKRKLPWLWIPTAAFLYQQIAGVETAKGAVVDPCTSSASSEGTYPADNSDVVFVCPQGDGDFFGPGLTINVAVRDDLGVPIPGIAAADIWLQPCLSLLSMCGSEGLPLNMKGIGAIAASGPTDANGQTTITGQLAAGGCELSGLRVVVQGVVIGAVCSDPCVPIAVLSADLNMNLMTDIVDFAIFGAHFPTPAKPYYVCGDYAAPFGLITLPDFAKFGAHINHHC